MKKRTLQIISHIVKKKEEKKAGKEGRLRGRTGRKG